MHVSVLKNEVLTLLDPKPGETHIDATIDGGGHAFALLEKVRAEGVVVGIDRDCEEIALLQKEIEKRGITNLITICKNYAQLPSIAREHRLDQVSGILFDLGFSSYHIEASGRGFTFLRDEVLDMRYDPRGGKTAAEILKESSEAEIIEMLSVCGEERYARRIAGAITQARAVKEINYTKELCKIIEQAVPYAYRNRRIHPATRTFQALRITVNDELGNLQKGLAAGLTILVPGGRLAVITFHSLEDRIVKNFFRIQERERVGTILTKKPITPQAEEIQLNPHSRSAKLRGFRKT